jgi:iron complex outermembrane receptor protein
VRSLSAGYTFIDQTKHDAEGVFKSNYAMEYLKHKFVMNFTHRIWSLLSMSWDVRWQERMGSYMSGGRLVSYHPYWLLDAKLQWDATRYNVFVQATNITNHHYHDLGNVPQPGIWVMAGARLKLSLAGIGGKKR